MRHWVEMPLDLRENVPLGPLSTLGIGGPARYYLQASTEDAIREGVAWAAARGLPILVLGGGSNLVIADEGYPGLALHVGTRGVREESRHGKVEVTVEAGEPWDDLVALTVARGWAGLECLSGIPGRVGATPMQNVGAYGQEVCETVSSVTALDRRTGEIATFANLDCQFGYRQSRFKGRDRDAYVVLRVTYSLLPGGRPAVRYAELSRHLEGLGHAEPGLAQVREAVIALRRRKSMVLDAEDPDARSVGSFFMNPIVDETALPGIEERLRQAGVLGEGERPPRFDAGAGRVKLSAAWLIERAGLTKGYGTGPARLSSRHTLAIVNRGGARARDVVALAREVRDRVRDRFGVTLVPEPVFVELVFD